MHHMHCKLGTLLHYLPKVACALLSSALLPSSTGNAARTAAPSGAAAAASKHSRAGCRLLELQHSAGASLLEPVAQRGLLDVGHNRIGRLGRC